MLEKKLISWKEYLYFGVVLAVMMSIRDDSREEFLQFLLVVVFFLATGISENISRLKSFATNFPLYTAMTATWTVYFTFIDKKWPTSGRYAISVFAIIFAGFVLVNEGEDVISSTFNNVWVLSGLMTFVSLLDFVLTSFAKQRMFFFYNNCNMEGYAIVIFLCITLLFMKGKAVKIAGTILSLVALACTGSKACTLIGALLVLYLCAKKPKNIDFSKLKSKRNRITAILIILIVILFSVAIANFSKGVFTSLYGRYMDSVADIERFFSGEAQPADSTSSTNLRLMDIEASLNVFPSSSFGEIFFGRGLMHQYRYELNPILSRIHGFGGNDGGVAGPAENTFLSLMYDSGMIAFAMYVAVYISAIICLFQRKDEVLKKISVILSCLMSLGLTVDMEYIISIMFIEWIFIGMFIGRLCSEGRKSLLSVGFSGSLLLIPLIYVLPELKSWIKTILNGAHILDNYGFYLMAYSAVSGLIIGIVVFICAISMAIYRFLSSKRLSWMLIAGCMAGIVILVAGGFACNNCIGMVQVSISERMMAEKDFISSVIKESDSDIYVDTFPEAYSREFGNISNSVMCSRGLAAYDNVTLIADKSLDSHIFSNRGFLCMPISEWDIAYTNDSDVIAYLEEAGAHLRSFNDYTHDVKISDKSVHFYPGQYTAYFYLSTDANIRKSNNDDNSDACSLKIVNSVDETVIAEKTLAISQFDESGNIICDLTFSTDTADISFQIIQNATQMIKCDRLSYKRTPLHDTHVTVDTLGRTIHAEYYDLDGNRTEVPGGYYGADYGYDNVGNQTMVTYLGEDMNPTICDFHYATAKLTFNNQRWIIREEYYDADGNPILLPSGQAAVEYEYDDYGNRIVDRYYNLDNDPVLMNDSFWYVHKTYNDKRQVIYEEYFGTDNLPITLPAGYAKVSYTYDDKDCITCFDYYDEKGILTLNSFGYARIRRKYNDRKQIISDSYYGVNDEPIMSTNGYSKLINIYDTAGNLIKTKYYNLDGNIVNDMK